MQGFWDAAFLLTVPSDRRRQPVLLLAVALVASLAIHLAALFGLPQFQLSRPRSTSKAIDVRIVAAPARPPTPSPLSRAARAAPAQAAPARPPRPAPLAKQIARATPRDVPPASRASREKPGALAAPPAPAAVPPAAPVDEARLAGAPAELRIPGAPRIPADAPVADDATHVAPRPPGPRDGPGANPGASGSRPTSGPSNPLDGAAADQAPAPPAHYPYKEVTLQFDLLYGQHPMWLGTVTHTLRIERGYYSIEQVGQGRGLVGKLYQTVIGGPLIQRSAGTMGPSGFVPDEYFAQRGRPDRRERALFNWSQHSVLLSSRNDQRKLALAPGTQDLVSTVHQFYFMRPFPREGTVTIATGRKLGRYLFEEVGHELLETPLGKLRTLHVKRLDPDGDRVELWLDEDHDMLPARIYSAYRDGLVLDFVIRRDDVVLAD